MIIEADICRKFVLPKLIIPPIFYYGNGIEIAAHFGVPEKLRDAVIELQTLLYAT
jgi:hypothetical protein